jgi:Calcineurin-like phosphoesterase
MARDLPDDELRAAVAALDEAGSYRKAAAALGLPASTLQARVKRAAIRGLVGGPAIPAIGQPPAGFAITHNAAAYDASGNLLRQWVGSRPDSGEEYAIPAGQVLKEESALVDAEGRIRVKWIKTKAGAKDGLSDALRATFAEYDGAAPVVPSPTDADDDLLTVYPIPDLHFGMMSWGRETGQSYDIKIATEMALRSVANLIEQSKPSKRAVILGLGDYFHANDSKSVTPGHGHLLDVDGRWPKVYAAGARLATSIVDLAARKHQEVEVVFLPGNHDPDAAMSLTVALALFYSNTPRISIHQDPGIAWYCRHGKVLLGATHGHTMKPDKMAMMLATDRAEDWGQTSFRHMFFGHIHHETASEVGPVRVESFSSPAARDAFNAAGGYRSSRAMNALTFHRERGEVGRHRVNI